MRNKKPSDLTEEIYKILIPQEYLQDFEVNSVENHPAEWVIELVEKRDRIPKELQGKDAVLDGYCNEVDVLSHAFSLKKIYLRLLRRRWKERGQTKYYFNTYDLYIPGMKTTREFRDFLKEIGG